MRRASAPCSPNKASDRARAAAFHRASSGLAGPRRSSECLPLDMGFDGTTFILSGPVLVPADGVQMLGCSPSVGSRPESLSLPLAWKLFLTINESLY